MSKNKFEKIKERFIHYGTIILGTSILSFGLFNVHSQSQITEGGVLGLILLLEHWLNISPGFSGFILNTLCFLLGFKLLGKPFFKDAMVSSISFSISYRLFENIGLVLPNLSHRPILTAIVGGVFVGVGAGLVVRRGGASGGDDALALVISKKLDCKISSVYFGSDAIVLLLSLTYIPLSSIAYSLLSVIVSSRLIDRLQVDD